MDSQTFKAAATASIDEIVRYFDGLDSRPVVSTVEPGYLRKLLPSEAPEHGEPWADIHKDLETKIVPGITHWQSPNFFAFFPCPSSYPSILGELYSATFTTAAFNWICSPAVTELETIVLDWLAKLLGLPEAYLSTGPTLGGGVVHGTASEAVLTMMVAARDKYLRDTTPAAFADGGMTETEREDLLCTRRGRLVALASAAAHSSTKKAARILGLRFRSVPAPAADGYALTGPALRATLERCRAEGLEPFFLTATLGTTDTCAVDDLAAVASVLAEHRAAAEEVWVHVDAAYGGAALVCPEVRSAVGASHLAACHSFNVNMHKWLLTNFDASCVFVRDRRWLVESLGADWHVYRNTFSDGGLVTDYRDWQIPLGRRFRSLKIWFVLRSFGADGLRAYVRKSIRQGETFADGLKARPDLFHILTGPSLALTVFRMAGDEADQRTRKLYERVNASGKIWTTSTQLDGTIFAIRVHTANPLTEETHVRNAVELFIATAEAILSEEH